MNGFLDQVAADLWARYGAEVARLGVVFPSRRARLFFGEALAEIVPEPVWQPVAVSVDELAERLACLAVGERLRMVVELYKVYAEFHPTESFDRFYFWGELLLGDFDAVDKYLVDADALFSNLVDLHEMDALFEMEPEQRQAVERFWGSFSMGSPQQKDFLDVWRTLGPVYHRFRGRLTELGIGYQGMVYRRAAERIADGSAPELPGRRYVVAGFNALSRSEQAIFEHLRRTSGVDFYWDADEYFTTDERQEAGMFMRDNLRRFPQASPLGGGHDNFRKPKRITSVTAASDVLQCKYAGGVLADIARRQGAAPGRETAVVLCDEGLLMPLLWSMPPEVEGINITMGYPLRMHTAYTFTERLIELQNRRRGSGDGAAFYHSDVEGLARHPYIAAGGATASTPLDFVYISAARLRTGGGAAERIFRPAGEGWRDLAAWLVEVISEVARPAERELDPPARPAVGSVEAGVFALVVEHIRRLGNSLEGCGVELSTRTYARLLRRSLQSATIPFEGEPLEGVQVMGILETRALDFDNVIFLSTGDDRMPGNLVGAPSFIPYSLKTAYGLPTPEHHEGVFAYHFFRLVGRASQIDLVWPGTSDDGSPGQPSHFILQLDYESPHRVEHGAVSVDVNLAEAEPIVIEKDAEVMARLEEFLEGGRRALSPSLFYTYTECPLKFYMRGVARLRARDEVTEDVDGAMLGNILHHAMQRLYTPLVGVTDPRPAISALIGSDAVESAVTAAVTELYTGHEGAGPDDWGGAVLLAHRTVREYIDRRVLPYDAAQASPFTIEALERPVEGTVRFEAADGVGRAVLFRGYADRVDRTPRGTLRVVDYKTGNPKTAASALLQMGLYATMLSADGTGEDVDPALYYVRDMWRADYSPPPVERGEGFASELRANLAEMFDPTVPFSPCEDKKTCEFCDFRPYLNCKN